MPSAVKRIVLSGGGTAGHITPLLAVARELRRLDPSLKLTYIGEQNGKFNHVAARGRLFDDVKLIPAGKLRRYHGQSKLERLTDIKTLLLNIRDFFRFCGGIMYSLWIIGKLKPTAIFLKGGFVCVPVAIAARVHKVAYLTHDSDVLPGLANRLAARWARYHATALPPEYYPYPPASIREVGVPIDEHFQYVDKKAKTAAKKELGLDPSRLLLYVTGGSHGARRLNEALIQIAPQLIDHRPRLQIIHQIGAGNEDQYNKLPPKYKAKIKYFGVTGDQHLYSAAADIIITRAGATAMSEFAAQGKACIVVPNPFLSGGHQLKNAEVFENMGAALIVQESEISNDAQPLYAALVRLIDAPLLRHELANKLHSTNSGRTAARDIASLILEIAA